MTIAERDRRLEELTKLAFTPRVPRPSIRDETSLASLDQYLSECYELEYFLAQELKSHFVEHEWLGKEMYRVLLVRERLRRKIQSSLVSRSRAAEAARLKELP